LNQRHEDVVSTTVYFLLKSKITQYFYKIQSLIDSFNVTLK